MDVLEPLERVRDALAVIVAGEAADLSAAGRGRRPLEEIRRLVARLGASRPGARGAAGDGHGRAGPRPRRGRASPRPRAGMSRRRLARVARPRPRRAARSPAAALDDGRRAAAAVARAVPRSHAACRDRSRRPARCRPLAPSARVAIAPGRARRAAPRPGARGTCCGRDRLAAAWAAVQGDHGAAEADLHLVGVYGPLPLGAVDGRRARARRPRCGVVARPAAARAGSATWPSRATSSRGASCAATSRTRTGDVPAASSASVPRVAAR